MKRIFTRCMVCPRVSVRSAVCQKNNRKSFIKHHLMNTCARCVVCRLFFVVFYHVVLLYDAHAITYILYVAYSSSFEG